MSTPEDRFELLVAEMLQEEKWIAFMTTELTRQDRQE